MSQTTTQTETDCLHDDCNGTLGSGPDDDSLPETIAWKKCGSCGQLYEYYVEQETLKVNL